jgi:hypothetical protein
MAIYLLGAAVFGSKAEAKAAFRRILNDHPDDVPLRGDDAELVSLLIHEGRHPQTAEKVGPGIAEIVVRPSGYGTRGFWLRRVDGSTVDFSYLTALDGPPRPEANVRAALRWEIDDQIAIFRDRHRQLAVHGLVTCELCGQLVAAEGAHVDHAAPTFHPLASRFAQATGGWTALTVECVGATGRRLVDRQLAQVWRLYHGHTARLRLVHAHCNLTRGRSLE